MMFDDTQHNACEKCRDLMSGFLDDELEAAEASMIREHLSACGECADLCAELSAILEFCGEEPSEAVADAAPPNADAMWKRINNVLEAEIKAPPPSLPETRRTWGLSFFQVSAALACVAIVSSLLTFVAIRNYNAEPDTVMVTRTVQQPGIVDRVLIRFGFAESPAEKLERRLRERQAAIDYWNAKVQVRRMQWDRTTREAFDRNLRAIDESLFEYTNILQSDPEDQLSEEMLDAVLNDKMNLLRDFAAL
ncbi:MAG: zf-HC2 domain-containing protein [Acidobacteria bacterium]|nr:zf-HC2 domain-containing protein [Acidobacteriota bacterium]